MSVTHLLVEKKWYRLRHFHANWYKLAYVTKHVLAIIFKKNDFFFSKNVNVFIIFTLSQILLKNSLRKVVFQILVTIWENVVATCKIGSFLCSLDNLLQKNVSVLFFGNQISKWRSFEKRAIFDLLFTFSTHQGKVTNIPSAHISLTYITCILLTLLTFFALPILKKKVRIYQVYGFSLV